MTEDDIKLIVTNQLEQQGKDNAEFYNKHHREVDELIENTNKFIKDYNEKNKITLSNMVSIENKGFMNALKNLVNKIRGKKCA